MKRIVFFSVLLLSNIGYAQEQKIGPENKPVLIIPTVTVDQPMHDYQHRKITVSYSHKHNSFLRVFFSGDFNAWLKIVKARSISPVSGLLKDATLKAFESFGMNIDKDVDAVIEMDIPYYFIAATRYYPFGPHIMVLRNLQSYDLHDHANYFLNYIGIYLSPDEVKKARGLVKLLHAYEVVYHEAAHVYFDHAVQGIVKVLGFYTILLGILVRNMVHLVCDNEPIQKKIGIFSFASLGIVGLGTIFWYVLLNKIMKVTESEADRAAYEHLIKDGKADVLFAHLFLKSIGHGPRNNSSSVERADHPTALKRASMIRCVLELHGYDVDKELEHFAEEYALNKTNTEKLLHQV